MANSTCSSQCGHLGAVTLLEHWVHLKRREAKDQKIVQSQNQHKVIHDKLQLNQQRMKLAMNVDLCQHKKKEKWNEEVANKAQTNNTLKANRTNHDSQ